VLTLSWSPGFCDTGGAAKSPEECAAGAGEGFVVHGLWPENFNRAIPRMRRARPYFQPGDGRDAGGVYPNEASRATNMSSRAMHRARSGKLLAAVKYARDQFAIPTR